MAMIDYDYRTVILRHLHPVVVGPAEILVGFPGVGYHACYTPPAPLPTLMGYGAFDRLLANAMARMQAEGREGMPLQCVQVTFYISDTDTPLEVREALRAFLNSLPEDNDVVDCQTLPTRSGP